MCCAGSWLWLSVGVFFWCKRNIRNWIRVLRNPFYVRPAPGHCPNWINNGHSILLTPLGLSMFIWVCLCVCKYWMVLRIVCNCVQLTRTFPCSWSWFLVTITIRIIVNALSSSRIAEHTYCKQAERTRIGELFWTDDVLWIKIVHFASEFDNWP